MLEMNHVIPHLQQQIRIHQEIRAEGFSPRKVQRLCSNGEYTKLRHGAYIPTSSWEKLAPWDKDLGMIIAWAKLSPGAVFSHLSAAKLLGLVTPPSQQVHIYTGTSKNKVKQVTKHIQLTEQTPVIRFNRGLIATTPLLTIVDCLRILPFKQGIVLADSALTRGMVAEDDLSRALTHATGRNCRKVRNAAAHISPLTESAGESYTRLLLDELALDYQEQVSLYIDGYHYRVDFMLKKYSTIIGFDGRIKLTDYGASDEVLERERYREKALQNAGWRVFRVDWDLVVLRPE